MTDRIYGQEHFNDHEARAMTTERAAGRTLGFHDSDPNRPVDIGAPTRLDAALIEAARTVCRLWFDEARKEDDQKLRQAMISLRALLP